jgi:hypothetical protein
MTTAILFALNTVIAIYSVWFYWHIEQLGRRYGWGHIPPSLFPIAPRYVAATFNALGVLQLVSFIIACIGFLVAMTKYRSAIKVLIGETFSYGWGWTIGSLFIPILGLYRPWVGFGEVRRAVIGIDRRRTLTINWKSNGANFGTVILALVWIGGMVTLRVTDIEGVKLARTPGFGLDQVTALKHYLAIEAGLRIIIFGTVIWYLRSIASALQRDLSAPIHSRAVFVSITRPDSRR